MAKEKKVSTEEKSVEKKEKKPTNANKLTYEQLEQLTSQYYNQAKALNAALEEAEKKLTEATNQIEMYQKNEFWIRLDWLWRILTLEGSNELFTNEFIDKVSEEFMLRMYPPKPKTEKTEEPKN